MRVIFMGTPAFALPAFMALLELGQNIIAVVTQPDRARGRGQKVSFSPVKARALERGLPVLQPEGIEVENLKELQPDLIVVVAFGQILPQAVLALPRYGCLNVHASLLPAYRGAAPLARALMAGEQESGVTLMLMEQGLDTGAILAQRALAIPQDFTRGLLHDSLAQQGALLLKEILPLWFAGKIKPEPQNEAEASYAPRLTKADERLEWTATATVLYNQIRALNPAPGAYTLFREKPLKIWASVLKSDSQGKPGTIIALEKGQGFVVQTGQGALLIKEVQPAGKKKMAALAFVNGYQLKVGDSFV